MNEIVLCEYGCGKEAKFQLKNGKWCCEKSQNSCDNVKKIKNNSKPIEVQTFNLCDYGCGQEAKYQFKNGKWCCSNHSNKCTAMSIKYSGNNCVFKRAENIEKIKLANVGRKASKETKLKLSERRKGTKNPFYNKKHTEESKLKISLKNLGHKGPVWTKEQIEEIRVRSKKYFLDSSYLKKLQKGLNTRPNKVETKILELLNYLYPDKFSYCGDFSFWIDGKNPDFVDISNKKVIDFFGYSHEYWYRSRYKNNFESDKDHEEKRINHFEKEGYKSLILWDKDLKEMENLIIKIKEFIEK